MSEAMPLAEFWLAVAMIAQAALIFALILALPFPRFAAAAAKKVIFMENGSPVFPKRTQQLGDCVNNQFQVPVLFFVAVLMFMQLGGATMIVAILAGVFVVFRYVHAAIFVTTNFIPARFLAFVVSTGALMAMWVILAMRILSQA